MTQYIIRGIPYQISRTFTEFNILFRAFQGLPESWDWTAGGRSLDLTEPMTAEERAAKHTSVLGVISWVFNSLALRPPPGLRHHAKPTSGALMRNRLLLEQNLVDHGSLVPSELSVHFSEVKTAAHGAPRGSFRKMMSMGAFRRGDSGGDAGPRPITRTSTGTPFSKAAAGLHPQPLFRGGERPAQIPEEASPEEGTDPNPGLPTLQMTV